MTQSVAILGAGPSGLAQLRAFDSARRQGADIPRLVCYEKQPNWGGQWNYTWRTGLDQNGEPVHSSMYRYLWSNGPKECLEFADYSFEEHFGRPIPSYPPRAVLQDYIMGRVEQSDVRQYIEFETAVRWVSYDEKTERFTVTVMDYQNNRLKSEEFDWVVSATGHFSTPNMPYFDGLETFRGRVMHAHDFRDAREFVGKHVLMVGSSYSAEDIGSQCYKYGAASVTFSYRSAPMGYDWPPPLKEVPLISSVDKNTVYFIDGTQEEFDAIVMCTGYLHHFPYLPDDLRLITANRMYAPDLYKGVVWEDNPKLMYLGMQDQYFTFNMLDAQAWFARDLILGRITLPDAATMHNDVLHWLDREAQIEDSDDAIDFQGAYTRDLISMTDYPDFAVEEQAELFKLWLRHKQEDIMGYRNQSYRSTITGTLAPPLPDHWMELLDDSLETFMTSTLESRAATDEPRATRS